MLRPKQYRRIVLASAWYDLFATIAFATPWTFALLHASLVGLAQDLALPGEFPPFAPAHMLMANLLGTIVTIWAVLRIRDPQIRYGRYDAAGRLLFAIWQVYAVMHGATTVILAFTAVEIAFFLAQALPVHPDQKLATSDNEPRNRSAF